MIVAMTVVWMVQTAVDGVVGVIAMRYCLMPTTRAVDVTTVMCGCLVNGMLLSIASSHKYRLS